MKFKYEEFCSRNWLFIDESLQLKIKNTKILIAGVGMGSYVACLAARTGFSNFIIADGDDVSLSNLNRQNFTTKDIGNNKAESLSKKLLEINPLIKIQTIPKFLNNNDLMLLIPTVDIVINTIDFDCAAFLECHLLSKIYNKLEIFPINLGFGAAICFNTIHSPSFNEYYKENNAEKIKHSILEELIISNNNQNQIKEFEKYTYKKNTNTLLYDPQIGVSTFIASCLIVSNLVKYLKTDTISLFPFFYKKDLINDF
jgi:hypothetical protein